MGTRSDFDRKDYVHGAQTIQTLVWRLVAVAGLLGTAAIASAVAEWRARRKLARLVA